MIEVCHLVKRYGKFTAVDDLSFQIPDGCVFGFVGPNGAGKTTTMRIMAGLLRQDGGEILYDGREMTTDSRFLKETVGYMPDFFGVYDNLKVKEYMDFFAGTYAIPYRDRPALIGDLLELVDLTQKEDAYVDSLSRGMKQRLCLARSLIHDPKLLILEEPASGLDPRARVEMKEILKALGDMGKTILISSHILPELAEMCGRIGIIDHGKMVTQGTVAEILHRMTKKRIFRLKVLDQTEQAAKVASEFSLVTDLVEGEKELRFGLDGEAAAQAQLLRAMIEQNVPVTEFREMEGNLEEIFMAVTGGEEEA